jgi:hypothetical protein
MLKIAAYCANRGRHSRAPCTSAQQTGKRPAPAARVLRRAVGPATRGYCTAAFKELHGGGLPRVRCACGGRRRPREPPTARAPRRSPSLLRPAYRWGGGGQLPVNDLACSMLLRVSSLPALLHLLRLPSPPHTSPVPLSAAFSRLMPPHFSMYRGPVCPILRPSLIHFRRLLPTL